MRKILYEIEGGTYTLAEVKAEVARRVPDAAKRPGERAIANRLQRSRRTWDMLCESSWVAQQRARNKWKQHYPEKTKT